MLRVSDLYTYLTTNIVYKYYINEFTSTSADNSAVVTLTPGFAPSEWTQKKRPSFQVLIRNTKPQDAESKAYEIYDYFHNKTEFKVGNTRVVHCTADQSAPMYIGQDENNRYLYSVNFTVTTL